jgi:hypothetical protein
MFLLKSIQTIIDCFDSLFDHSPSQKNRWLTSGWLAALYLIGLLAWGFFLNWGKIGFTYPDWVDVTAPRLTFVQSAVSQGLLPLHISDSAPLGNVTDRYMVIPDAFLSPQAILLTWMDVDQFVLVDILIMYSLGYIGLLLLKKRLALSAMAFTPLFLLFNFNGDILAHISIGHFTWGGYFLFPFFGLLIFRLLDGSRGWKWISATAVLLFLILLQGSYHQFVWLLIFLCLLGLTRRKYFIPAFGGATFSVLLSLVRLLPPSLGMGTFVNRYHGGYPDLGYLLRSLVEMKYPGDVVNFPLFYKPLGAWELDCYIGAAGALFILIFAILRWLGNHGSSKRYQDLAFTLAALTALSIGVIFEWFRLIPIPLLGAERVSSRIFSLPLTFLFFLAAMELQRWWNETQPSASSLLHLICLAPLLVMVHDLWQNLKIWRVASAALGFEEKWFNIKLWFVNNHYDAPYFTLLYIGAAGSLITLALLAILSWRENRKRIPTKPS